MNIIRIITGDMGNIIINTHSYFIKIEFKKISPKIRGVGLLYKKGFYIDNIYGDFILYSLYSPAISSNYIFLPGINDKEDNSPYVVNFQYEKDRTIFLLKLKKTILEYNSTLNNYMLSNGYYILLDIIEDDKIKNN